MRTFKFDKPLVESTLPPRDTDVLWIDKDEQDGKLLTIKEYKDGEWVTVLNSNSSSSEPGSEGGDSPEEPQQPSATTYSGFIFNIKPNYKQLYTQGEYGSEENDWINTPTTFLQTPLFRVNGSITFKSVYYDSNVMTSVDITVSNRDVTIFDLINRFDYDMSTGMSVNVNSGLITVVFNDPNTSVEINIDYIDIREYLPVMDGILGSDEIKHGGFVFDLKGDYQALISQSGGNEFGPPTFQFSNVPLFTTNDKCIFEKVQRDALTYNSIDYNTSGNVRIDAFVDSYALSNYTVVFNKTTNITCLFNSRSAYVTPNEDYVEIKSYLPIISGTITESTTEDMSEETIL